MHWTVKWIGFDTVQKAWKSWRRREKKRKQNCAVNISRVLEISPQHLKSWEIIESAPSRNRRERRIKKARSLSVRSACVCVALILRAPLLLPVSLHGFNVCVRKACVQLIHRQWYTTTMKQRPLTPAQERSARTMTAFESLVLLWLSRRQHVEQFRFLLQLHSSLYVIRFYFESRKRLGFAGTFVVFGKKEKNYTSSCFAYFSHASISRPNDKFSNSNNSNRIGTESISMHLSSDSTLEKKKKKKHREKSE